MTAPGNYARVWVGGGWKISSFIIHKNIKCLLVCLWCDVVIIIKIGFDFFEFMRDAPLRVIRLNII